MALEVTEVAVEGLGVLRRVGSMQYVLILNKSAAEILPQDETKRLASVHEFLERYAEKFTPEVNQLDENYRKEEAELKTKWETNRKRLLNESCVIGDAKFSPLEVRVED